MWRFGPFEVGKRSKAAHFHRDSSVLTTYDTTARSDIINVFAHFTVTMQRQQAEQKTSNFSHRPSLPDTQLHRCVSHHLHMWRHRRASVSLLFPHTRWYICAASQIDFALNLHYLARTPGSVCCEKQISSHTQL